MSQPQHQWIRKSSTCYGDLRLVEVAQFVGIFPVWSVASLLGPSSKMALRADLWTAQAQGPPTGRSWRLLWPIFFQISERVACCLRPVSLIGVGHLANDGVVLQRAAVQGLFRLHFMRWRLFSRDCCWRRVGAESRFGHAVRQPSRCAFRNFKGAVFRIQHSTTYVVENGHAVYEWNFRVPPPTQERQWRPRHHTGKSDCRAIPARLRSHAIWHAPLQLAVSFRSTLAPPWYTTHFLRSALVAGMCTC